MAASLDTSTNAQHLQHHTYTRDSQRGKRSFSSPALALASLRNSLSQVSLRDDQNQRKSNSTTSSPSTVPVSTQNTHSSRGVDPGANLQGVKSRNSVSQDPKSPLPQLQIPYKDSAAKKNKKPLAEHGDEEYGYFGDIIDKYCNSDEDPTSPSTASPTSPFSTTHSWADFKSPQPPTPPVTSNRHQQYQNPDITHHRRATPLRNSSTALPDASSTTSPMLAASARFNAYLQSTSNRSSSDSLQFNGSIPLSSNQSSPSPSIRTYSKRPVPVPGSAANASPRAPAISTTLSQSSNRSTPEPREKRPELPPKDSHRQASSTQFNHNGNSQPLQQLNTFSTVVEEAVKRNKATSVSSLSSSSSGSVNPYAENATRERGSMLNYLSGTQQDRPSQQKPQPQQQQQQQQQLYNQGQKEKGSASPTTPRSPGNEEQSCYQQQQQQWLQQQQQQQQQRYDQRQQRVESPYYQAQQSNQRHQLSSSYSSPSLTPSEMLARRFDIGPRSLSHGSLTNVSKYSVTPQGLKSALVKSPIARAQAKDANGPRKVIFGDMITIVTVQRVETPPPLSPSEVKKTKKKSKKGKAGPHPDPEYNAEYYNAPFTPEPAEVLVTQAPWIGNPNYDEEKQNSSFYYDDDYENYDDYGYEGAPDIRLGPEDDEDDDEDEDEEDEDDDEYSSGHSWGNGIAGGASVPKKKGGIFKFKRAVNRLLRN
ncbi:hypothetical protein BGZ80_005672 [Entomortierella chlamydospora]|uniref:Uncharacterized protein n=1 Tax=Entomortierella chlamydospora TaxID=101097 RepID=A0A9P6MJK3_9FUNG|nr:hypothetical protein BGZ80_005672 [Entomortierella chlamydospora]